VRADFH